VCTYKCVEEKQVQKYTCMVSRQVPCKATRTVRVCVPYQETVTCCRMVPRTREIQVPVCETTSNACETSNACCESSSSSCCESRGHGLFGGFRRGGHGGNGGGCCR
jgi:hypothetical protein